MGPLSLADGTPTGGVYGFAAVAMEIVRKLNPTKVVVAWDSKTSTKRRREIYPEYKAGRVKPGDDFYTQIPLLKELVDELGWNFLEVEEYEADDIIGTLSRQADEVLNKDGKCEYETYIISSDLDMLQIVDENTHMWRILKGFSNIEQIDVKELETKYGILKSQFLDLKALKGDASDNIPGVPGVGEKTAVKLLNEYGSLDGVYDNLDKIKGGLKVKLVEGKKSAYMSRDLAKIMFYAPVKLEELKDFSFNKEKVAEGLKRLEFNSLIRKLGNLETAEDGPKRLEDEEGNCGIPTDLLIGFDIKKLMHEDKKIAKDVLAGRKFWDLTQAEFLLNPLARSVEENLPKRMYIRQKLEYEKNPKLLKVLEELDFPLIPVLYKMEEKGMLIDQGYFKELQNEYEGEAKELESKIFKSVGKEFNINSPIQLSEVLFEGLKLPTKGIKKTTRGYSTGAKELEKLKGLHSVIELILSYREVTKLLSTYIIPIPEVADGDNRIHTTFTQNVTATGRLSSLNPNLQNIPVRTAEGKRIRKGFIAPEGKVLVSADYSQFELRLAAIIADDEDLIHDFNKGVDIHTKTAAEAFKVPLAEVTKDQRRAAKVINFGILYGMSVKGLAEAAKMEISVAKRFIDNYFELRAPIKRKLEDILKQAREEGFVETYYGRRRPTPDVKSSNFIIRQAAERAAQNMPIQGTEADLMKRAMIQVDKSLPAGAEIIMQVHDSLIVECDIGVVAEVKNILKREMEGVAPELKIKLAVEVTEGKNWGEL